MVTFKEIMERDMPEQTIFVGDVVKWHKHHPIGMVGGCYIKHGFRLLSIVFYENEKLQIVDAVDQHNCELVGKNCKLKLLDNPF